MSCFESCVDQTLLASLPDFGSAAVNEETGEMLAVELHQIPKSMEKDLKSVKALVRSHGLGVAREERRHFWVGAYKRREGGELEAPRDFYWETVKTCFGSDGKESCTVSWQRTGQESCTVSWQRTGVIIVSWQRTGVRAIFFTFLVLASKSAIFPDFRFFPDFRESFL